MNSKLHAPPGLEEPPSPAVRVARNRWAMADGTKAGLAQLLPLSTATSSAPGSSLFRCLPRSGSLGRGEDSRSAGRPAGTTGTPAPGLGLRISGSPDPTSSLRCSSPLSYCTAVPRRCPIDHTVPRTAAAQLPTTCTVCLKKWSPGKSNYQDFESKSGITRRAV